MSILAVFCPKHHIQLEIKKTHFTIPRNPTLAVVGSCPMCNLKYINRNLFGNAKTTIAGERYEYLKDLAIMFPFDEREELQLRTQEEARRRKQEEKEKKELARQEQLRKQEEKAKRRAQQKELERIKREKALEQKQKIKRRTDEAIRRAKELKFQEKKNEYINNPNTPFQVAQIAYFNPIPPICPYDEEALIYATNIQQQSQNAGYVCIRCGRLFLDKIKSKETAAKRRQEKKLDITFPETLHGKNGLISAINPKTFEHAYTRETLVWVAICNALRKGKRLPLKSGNLANLLPPKQISQYFSLRGTCVSLAMRYCNEVTNRTEIQLEFEKAFHNYSAVVAGKRNLPDYYTFGLLQEISGRNDTTREQCEQILEQRLMLPILKSYYKYQHEQNIQAAKQNSIKLPKKISEIPKSTILEVSLSAKLVGKIGCVAIVANQLDQAAESGIFWVGRTFASMILAAIQIDPDRQFNYKGIEYQIDSIVEYSESKKYFGIISRFCNPTSPQTVFVFSQKNIELF